ncbi:MAG: hypothetical protein WD770_09375 [Actinomycetota bacterium]
MLLAVALWVLAPGVALAHDPHILPEPDPAEPEIARHDLQKGSLHGSPLDDLPAHIRVLPIRLPNDAAPMRADWSPDGRRLVFLDAPIGNVWQHDLATRRARRLTGARGFLPGGVLRAQHLSNGDLVLCAPRRRSADDPEGDRFRGELWVLPLRGKGRAIRPPVRLREPCWEGIAVSKQRGSTRIAWNRSVIDFTDVPGVFVQALNGQSQILTGRIAYGKSGKPSLVDKMLVVDRYDVGPDAIVEAQDFRALDDGDADVDDELIFSAYFHRGGQVMGVDLETGRIADYSRSPWYEEPEGIDPAGRYLLVERDLAIVAFPGELDIWRLTLDCSGDLERLTTFNHHDNYGATNPVVAPDGRRFAFQLEQDGSEHGQGHALLLFDIVKWDAQSDRTVEPDRFLLPPRC